MIKISPSVLACDLSRLADEVGVIERAGAEMAHLDVMDGCFVPNMSFGMPVIEALRRHSGIIFDVHLMIVEPEKYAERFIDAGADIVTFHYEAAKDSAALLDLIRSKGAKAAISIKPKTSAQEIFHLLDKCDMVLVMTVEPGYGGQSFMPDMLPKIKALREEIERRGLNVDIEVDGGINPETAKLVKEAGANVLVAGSSVFKAEDRKAAIDALR
ncbi:MAG: ribulose-phosphate 3-epimerase [Clostridia bacterium]|nr:ribulose-phosphate 3-epimerase [Clostridia bacterium]